MIGDLRAKPALDRDREKRLSVLPSLQTGRADFPHPAFQSVVHLREE
jgi:hypothetical protein